MIARRLNRIARWIDCIAADLAAVVVGLVLARLLLIAIDVAARSMAA